VHSLIDGDTSFMASHDSQPDQVQCNADTQDSNNHTERVLLRVADVARMCGVSRKTVDFWISSENLPSVQLPGRGARLMTFVSPSDLSDWIANNRSIHQDPKSTPQPTVTIKGRRFIQTNK